jgi:hypothetical protein
MIALEAASASVSPCPILSENGTAGHFAERRDRDGTQSGTTRSYVPNRKHLLQGRSDCVERQRLEGVHDAINLLRETCARSNPGEASVQENSVDQGRHDGSTSDQ